MTTVTQWFSVLGNPPAHTGDYEYRYVGCPYVFKVKWWAGRFLIADRSFADGDPVTTEAGDQWRGLAVKPKSGISSK